MIDDAIKQPPTGLVAVDQTFADQHAKQELARLTAERERIASERDARAAAKKLQDDIAAAKIALADEQAIASAEAEYGAIGVEIAVVRTPAGCIIVKRPNHMRYRRWADAGKYKTEDVEILVTPCIVYPDRAAYDEIVQRFAAVSAVVGGQVLALAGHKVDEAGGKS